MDFIFEDSEKSSSTPFLDLGPQARDLATKRLILILEQSFQTEENRLGKEFRQRISTQAEEKKRAKILFKWLRIMRGDMGYSLQQSLDLLPYALRTELDGGTYTPPPKNRLWTPGGVLP